MHAKIEEKRCSQNYDNPKAYIRAISLIRARIVKSQPTKHNILPSFEKFDRFESVKNKQTCAICEIRKIQVPQ